MSEHTYEVKFKLLISIFDTHKMLLYIDVMYNVTSAIVTEVTTIQQHTDLS